MRLVLLRPRNPQNLGAVARAMKNFGLFDWAVVELGTYDFATARRVAVGAEDLLDRPQLFRTLDEAVSDCAWVVGTSSRKIRGKRRLTPAEVAREIFERAGTPDVGDSDGGRVAEWRAAREQRPSTTAIVFGDERSGLTNAEIDRCHDLSAIPTAPDQPSVNLAQAALLYAYELRKAAFEAAGAATSASRIEAAQPVPAAHPNSPSAPSSPASSLPAPSSPPARTSPASPAAPRAASATDADLARIEETLRNVLREAHFLAGPERHALRDLATTLRRSRLTLREARLWLAALKKVERRIAR